ncbi:MAG TPA: hypothetical protein VGL51_01510 [Solirubrobacteraceae bacterium]|jgi:hypothetical protein
MTDREEAQTAFAGLLLDRIRRDKYPSMTQMQILEQVIPRPLVREYLNVLLEKVIVEKWPSVSMLQRIARITQHV